VEAVVHCACDFKNKITDSLNVIIEANILSIAKFKNNKKYKIPKVNFGSSLFPVGCPSGPVVSEG
jgi:hypothetical protein